jgi:adenylate cyclase
MTEELITEVSRIINLKVISRTSAMQYQGTKKSARQIARELHVDAVVEGAVQLVGNRVRITAQLVDGTSDEQVWADHYDRELSDILLLQNEVATDIAQQIGLQLAPRSQASTEPQTSVTASTKGIPVGSNRAHTTVNPDAYRAYLLGRYYWNMRTADGLDKAGHYFARAIKEDPNFALAYSGQAYSTRTTRWLTTCTRTC